jgi:hypothetical protein
MTWHNLHKIILRKYIQSYFAEPWKVPKSSEWKSTKFNEEINHTKPYIKIVISFPYQLILHENIELVTFPDLSELQHNFFSFEMENQNIKKLPSRLPFGLTELSLGNTNVK